MKLFRWLPIAVVAVGISSTAAAAPGFSSPDEFNERDFEQVNNFIKTKRGIPLQEKSCDLMISGDIRFEWENYQEKLNGIRQRGKGAPQGPGWFHGERIPNNQFDIEFNLMFDYRGSCTWAVAHLEFDNNAGIDVNWRGCCGRDIGGACYYNEAGNGDGQWAGGAWVNGDPDGCHGSGFDDRLSLRKAFFGWNIFEECNSRLDVELGRRAFYDVFDSRVQFGSRFDGILFRYSNCVECVGDFYANLGLFVVDENSNHWGWVVELGLLDIADYGIDLKYSFIDWSQASENRCGVKDPMPFQVSQFYAAYNFNPELLCTRAKIYGAFLINHDAKDVKYNSIVWTSTFDPALPREGQEIGYEYEVLASYDYGKQDIAWYIGFMVGDVCKEGDWAFDINYQYVEANAFPECDLTGIGKGNVRNVPFTINPARGWLNYQGVRAEGLYALTDNLTLHPSWEYSTNIEDFANNGALGFVYLPPGEADLSAAYGPLYTDPAEQGKRTDSTYSKFELEVIYAF